MIKITDNVTISGSSIIFHGHEIYYDQLEEAWCIKEIDGNEFFGRSIEGCCNKILEKVQKDEKI